MTTDLTLDRLDRAAREDAAIRRIRRLQPVGGPGDKLLPPTYPNDKGEPSHVFEMRRNGDGSGSSLCVLLDSVQSQANRLEEALLTAREAGSVSFPAITVDFSAANLEGLTRITSLEAPHRVFDAIIRDSELDGTPFWKSGAGKQLIQATSRNARPVYDLSPTALLFGAWNSTGEGGGLGAKFPRSIVSEIVGVEVATEPDPDWEEHERPSGKRTGSRIDPLGIRASVRVFKTPDGDWSLEPPPKGTKAKEEKPSAVNHSNIAPNVEQLGVSVEHALHSFVLSLTALRRNRLSESGDVSADSEAAGRAALAALGLVAATAQDRGGYFLRSRCELVPEESSPAHFEIVRPDGAVETVAIDHEQACALAREATERARQRDLAWHGEDVVLQPQAKLVDLVRLSREKALEGEPDEG